MPLKIKQNAVENSVEIDGTKFDMPTDKVRRDGLRELVVNHYCRITGQPLVYPENAGNI